MTGKDFLMAFDSVRQDYIEEAEYYSFPASKKSVPKRTILIAAVIGLAALLVGCAVAYALRMQDLWIGQRQETSSKFSEDGQQYLGEETVTQQVLTRAGLQGSPEYKAAQEWFTFLQAYDPDKSIFESMKDNLPVFPKEYEGYNLYSQKMKDKLDEILGAYQLKPLGEAVPFRTPKLLFEAMGISDVLLPDSAAAMEPLSAAFYRSGEMKVVGNLAFRGEKSFGISVFFHPKGYFSEDVALLSNAANWTEETLTTASGAQVLILTEGSGISWLFCDRPEYMVSVRVEDGNRQQLKKLANAVNFDLKPQIGDNAKTEEPSGGDGKIGDYRFSVKNVTSDGYTAWVTLSVTGPEGAKLLADEPSKILTYGNEVGFWSSVTPGLSTESYGGAWADDGDGKDNTAEYILEAHSREDNMAFGPGAVWKLYWEDLCLLTWDAEAGDFHSETLAEGTWAADITFHPETTGSLELVREPVATKIYCGWDLQGNWVLKDTTLHSVCLHPLSAVISCTDNETAPVFLYDDGPVVFLKDGSKIRLLGVAGEVGKQYLRPERQIDLDQVDYVKMADGVRLERNEESETQ